MNIGILTYHSVNNFGANLQVLSTVGFLNNNGHSPIIINWIPEDLELRTNKNIPDIQQYVDKSIIKDNAILTPLCRNSIDIAKVIKELNIDAVIIGSDAVVIHYSFFNRIVFPSRKIISILKPSSDWIFPNPFWGDFLNHLEKDIPIVMMSVSNQGTNYKLIIGKTKREMSKHINKFKYISVRDFSTKKMFEYISNKKIAPPITPDPVFAFNYNFNGHKPSKKDILEKFKLPEKYILFSFHNSDIISKAWLNSFKKIADESEYSCVALAFPSGIRFDHDFSFEINLPLSSIDWYYLIKYSSGYIGHNMHPIIVCLHNSVPFFSFDHYSKRRMFFFVNDKTSKIFHILSESGFKDNRVSSIIFTLRKSYDVNTVFNCINNFDKRRCTIFAENMHSNYVNMMTEILTIIES
jgi:hypothetical protein